MKLNRLIVLSSGVLIYTSLYSVDQISAGVNLPPEFLTNLPPWELSESPPEPILENPPVYLDVDSKGDVYRHYLVQDKSGTYLPKTERVTKGVMDELRSQREIILQNMEDISLPGDTSSQGSSAASTSTCPLPSSFSIIGDSAGTPSGFQKKANTYRPTGATTQWLVFDFYTANYRDRGSHMPMHLFHDEVVRGQVELVIRILFTFHQGVKK